MYDDQLVRTAIVGFELKNKGKTDIGLRSKTF